jgi:hypothetical protein
MPGPPLPPLYRRLPGHRRGLASSATLWWADDHLLVAEVRFWTETYRRIYFRDLQAMVVAEDGRWLAGNLLGLTLAILFGLFVAGTHDGWRIFWSIPALLVLVAAATHFARGPTCTCEMTTPLACVRVPLRRVRQARKAMRSLRPLIEQAQGQAAREAIVTQAAERGSTAPPPVPVPVSLRPPPLLRPGTTRAHTVLCACLLLDAMVTAYQWPRGNPLIDSIAAVVFLACVLASIWALVAQNGTDLGRPFAWFGAGALGTQLVLFFTGWMFVFFEIVRRAGTQTMQPDFTGRTFLSGGLEKIGPWEIGVETILAVWGLVLLLRWRRGRGSAWISLTS